MIWAVIFFCLCAAYTVAQEGKSGAAWSLGLFGAGLLLFRLARPKRRSYPEGRSKAHGATKELLRKAQAKERELLLTFEPRLLPNGEMGQWNAWERATTEAGLTGATLQQIEGVSSGFIFQVELRSGGTVDEVQSAKGKLESSLNLLRGAVTVEPGERARVVLLRVREGAPETAPALWPGAPPDASITRPTILGTYREGGPLELPLRNRHILIAGATDSGKSGVLNALVGYLAACSDAVLLGIDCKPGAVELRPWAPVLQRLASNIEDARKLLRMAFLELERRGDMIGDDGARKWPVSPERPAWVIVIDELRELTLDDECRELLERLTSLARFADITVIGATQYPTKQDLKSSVLVEQMTTKIALYVETPTASRVIFGDKAAQQGWTPDEIDGGPGTLYLRSRESRKPKLARAYYVTDAKVQETVKRYQRRRPELVAARPEPGPPESSFPPAGTALLNHAQPDEQDATPTNVVEFRSIESNRTTSGGEVLGEEHELLRELLFDTDEGRSDRELADETGMSLAWVKKWRQHFGAEQVERGLWRLP